MKKSVFSIMLMSVALLGFMACDKEDNPKKPKASNVEGSWICQYAEQGVTEFEGMPYDQVVEYYSFFDDGTGYYERYFLKDGELETMDYDRSGEGDFLFKQKKEKVKITLQFSEESWSLTCVDEQLTDANGRVFVRATPEQDEMTLDWYGKIHGGSGDIDIDAEPVTDISSGEENIDFDPNGFGDEDTDR
jgi:hypothetical protein